jgi:hypothetical protein
MAGPEKSRCVLKVATIGLDCVIGCAPLGPQRIKKGFNPARVEHILIISLID